MPSEGSPNRHAINLPRKTTLPFSDAVLVGHTLYISGRIGIDPATGMAPASIDEELRLLFDEFEAVLAAAGMNMDDLVSVQIFAPDVSLWEQSTASTSNVSQKICPREDLSDQARY